MDIRNARYNAFGTIDCEIDHPLYGWIPFTAAPDDVEPLGASVFGAVQESAEAYTPPPEPTEAEVLAAELEAAIAKEVAEAEAKRLADLREAVAAKYSGVKTAADIRAIKGRK